jgi:hypothetical protein
MITYTNIIEDFFIIFLILLVCGTPRKFVTTKLSIRKPGYRSSSVHANNLLIIINTDEDPGLRIESFAVINLRGVSTNKKYYMFYRHANLQRIY